MLLWFVRSVLWRRTLNGNTGRRWWIWCCVPAIAVPQSAAHGTKSADLRSYGADREIESGEDCFWLEAKGSAQTGNWELVNYRSC